MQIQPRGLIFAVIALIALALASAGAGTSLAYAHPYEGQVVGPGTTADVDVRVTAYEVCQQVTTNGPAGTNEGDEECAEDGIPGCQEHKFRVVRAFGLITVILALLALLIGIADLLSKLPMPLGRVILLTIAAFVVATSIVAWATIAVLWSDDCTGTAFKNYPDARFGPSGPLFVVVTVLALIDIVVALVVPTKEPSVLPKSAPAATANEPVEPASAITVP